MAYQRSIKLWINKNHWFNLQLVVIVLLSLFITFGALRAAGEETEALPIPEELQEKQMNLHRLRSCEEMIGFNAYTQNYWARKTKDLHIALTALYSCMRIKEMIDD